MKINIPVPWTLCFFSKNFSGLTELEKFIWDLLEVVEPLQRRVPLPRTPERVGAILRLGRLLLEVPDGFWALAGWLVVYTPED